MIPRFFAPRSASAVPRRGVVGAIAASVATLLSACSPIRVINALASDDTHRLQAGIAYGSHDRQLLDVYQQVNNAGRAPIVVFFYGGSWSSGERADYKFVGEALASRGIVAVVADYRLSPQVRYPAFVQDSALAVRWAREHASRFGADPARLMVMGHSAGGYNAAMLALDARWLAQVGMRPADLAGWIGIAGAYDFLPIGIPGVQVAFNWPDTPADSQPLFHASSQSPRALLLAARNDTLVQPQRNTVALAERLQRAGVPVQAELLDGVSHTTVIGAFARPLRRLAPVLDRVADFVQG